MSPRLVQLIAALFAMMLGGYFIYPVFYPLPKAPEAKPVVKKEVPTPTPVATVETEELSDDDFAVEDDSPEPEGEDDAVADDDLGGEQHADSYMPAASGLAEEVFREDNVPVDEAQNRFAKVDDLTRRSYSRNHAKVLAKNFERQEPKKGEKGLVRPQFSAEQWSKPEEIYNTLVERVLGKLGNLEDKKIWEYLEEPENRLDLAVLRLIYLAEEPTIREVAKMEKGAQMLATLSSDLEWMTGLLYSGPSKKMDKGLVNLARIYARFTADMDDPMARRIATTAAIEFAREGWAEREMMDRFVYYYSSYKAGKLNILFNDLQYWDMRLVTGCTEPGQTSWGSVRSMTWQRDNVRLPAEGYTGACFQIAYRLVNVAGDSVHGGDYLAPINKYTNNTKAWAHKEIGGVCGALSHFGAYGALATGIPAITMGEPGHCAMTVRVNGKWVKGNSIFWEHGLHKTFWGEHAWDFLILMQNLYTDRHVTLVSDHLVAMGDILSARRKMLAASRCYENAVAAQPLNWPAWLRCLGYLKLKDANNGAKWKELHDLAVETLASEYHHAASVLLAKYIYPSLFQQVKDRHTLNKLFASFFDQCKTYGNNRWDIGPLLDGQMSSCTTDEEKFAYMKDALHTLMGNPAYAGAVLSWGMDVTASMKGDEAAQEKFTDLIIKALSKARTTRKEMDATWAALGEAINATAGNGDRKTFQAIGKLAYRKCKKNFPKNSFRFKPLPGKIVSQTGLITTKTEMSGGADARACLHWGVLQKHGGSMPCKFGGQGDNIVVHLEKESTINGIVCIFASELRTDRDFVVDISSDGSAWTTLTRNVEVTGNTLRADTREEGKNARFVRLWFDGNKYEPTINGCYIFGKPAR